MKIQLNEEEQDVSIRIYNLSGVFLSEQFFGTVKEIDLRIENVSGLYIVEINSTRVKDRYLKVFKR